MARRRKKLGELLVSWNVVQPNDLADALAYANEHGKRIGESLVELEMASEDDVAKALAAQFDLEYIDLDKNPVPGDQLERIPNQLIKSRKVLPLSEENGRLKVIISDPLDIELLDLLRFRLNAEVVPVLAPLSKIDRFIETFIDASVSHSIEASIEEVKAGASIDVEAEKQAASAALEGEEGDAPIIKLINLLIAEAVRMRASDIHIEPMSDRVKVRYRVDGVCIERDTVPKGMQGPVTARLKIMAGIDIAEKRLPQDGRIKMKIGSTKTAAGEERANVIDFRVSSLPAYHGESIVLRILRPDAVKIGINGLGFEQDQYERFQRIIAQPNGIMLVTGPTGSGKTTTLYAALQELNRPDRKIITAEDPVEYNFSGMNQCQVREDIGFTFAKILRSMLRQAPEIILVGEIRDREVGEVAIQAALTGHLVFSTLHTNDAPAAITRLIDMGIKPFLVASSIQAILAQRLVRRICKECREIDPNPNRFMMRLIGIEDEDLVGQQIYRGAGCKRCSGIGYRGRQGIFEMLEMNTELRELAFGRAPAEKMRHAAVASGMLELLDDGKRKILKGITTPEEIARIVQSEGVVSEELEEV